MNSTETKTAHTPGPWELIYDGQAWPHVHAEYVPHGAICEMSSHDPQDEGNGDRARNRALANARLIAAAPELLEGMKELLECFREACANPETNMAAARTIAVAEQRIAKAEGRV